MGWVGSTSSSLSSCICYPLDFKCGPQALWGCQQGVCVCVWCRLVEGCPNMHPSLVSYVCVCVCVCASRLLNLLGRRPVLVRSAATAEVAENAAGGAIMRSRRPEGESSRPPGDLVNIRKGGKTSTAVSRALEALRSGKSPVRVQSQDLDPTILISLAYALADVTTAWLAEKGDGHELRVEILRMTKAAYMDNPATPVLKVRHPAPPAWHGATSVVM